MKRLKALLLAGLLSVVPSMTLAADMEVHIEGGKVVLTDKPCKNGLIQYLFVQLGAPLEVLQTLKEGRVVSSDGKVDIEVCYGEYDSSTWIVVNEQGGYGALPKPKEV